VEHHAKVPRLEDDTLLFEGGLGLDSFQVVQLISLTENHFKIEYREEDLTEDNFRTPRILASLLQRRGAV
jgi:acyl carrier protein